MKPRYGERTSQPTAPKEQIRLACLRNILKVAQAWRSWVVATSVMTKRARLSSHGNLFGTWGAVQREIRRNTSRDSHATELLLSELSVFGLIPSKQKNKNHQRQPLTAYCPRLRVTLHAVPPEENAAVDLRRWWQIRNGGLPNSNGPTM